jgi:hypothetical protein
MQGVGHLRARLCLRIVKKSLRERNPPQRFPGHQTHRRLGFAIARAVGRQLSVPSDEVMQRTVQAMEEALRAARSMLLCLSSGSSFASLSSAAFSFALVSSAHQEHSFQENTMI